MDSPCCFRLALRFSHRTVYSWSAFPADASRERAANRKCLFTARCFRFSRRTLHTRTHAERERDTPLPSSYSHPHESNRCGIDLQLHFPHTRPRICIIQRIDSRYSFQICRSAVRPVSLARLALSNDKEAIIRAFHFSIFFSLYFPPVPRMTFELLLFSAAYFR